MYGHGGGSICYNEENGKYQCLVVSNYMIDPYSKIDHELKCKPFLTKKELGEEFQTLVYRTFHHDKHLLDQWEEFLNEK